MPSLIKIQPEVSEEISFETIVDDGPRTSMTHEGRPTPHDRLVTFKDHNSLPLANGLGELKLPIQKYYYCKLLKIFLNYQIYSVFTAFLKNSSKFPCNIEELLYVAQRSYTQNSVYPPSCRQPHYFFAFSK